MKFIGFKVKEDLDYAIRFVAKNNRQKISVFIRNLILKEQAIQDVLSRKESME